MLKNAARFLLLLLWLGNSYHTVYSSNQSEISTTRLDITLSEIVGISLAYEWSSFDPFQVSYELASNGNSLTDGTRTVPLSALKPLLDSLHTLYPGTRPVSIVEWSDDYPYASIRTSLKDGRNVLITSTSQYGYMIPWNVQIWQGDPDAGGTLLNSYLLLHEDFMQQLSGFWMKLAGNPFPRNYGPERYWEGYEKRDTISFFISSESYDTADDESISGAPAGVTDPFIPLLEQNAELARLIRNGYNVFDLSFDVKVDVKTLVPLDYSGTVAFISPDSEDILVSTVDIQLEPDLVVTTPLTADIVEQRRSQRKGFEFLVSSRSTFPDLTFILDTREGADIPVLDCPENAKANQTDYTVQALLLDHARFPLTFYHLNKLDAWTVDAWLDKDWGNWNDDQAAAFLEAWFPNEISQYSPLDLQKLNTSFEIAFQPDVTETDPGLLESLRNYLPSQSIIHVENPQKRGDIGFARLQGRIILSDNGTNRRVIYCGRSRPDWSGPPYNTGQVITPNDAALRSNFGSYSDLRYAWTPKRGVPGNPDRVNWTALGVSQPGYVHLLWTDGEGVYYADGWADGTGWTKAQQLGGDSWNLQVRANEHGIVHLLWSTDPIGTMHVWRNAQGEWQQPEYWEGVGYFSQVQLDPEGNLHLTHSRSDGIDQEFFYQSWSPQAGLGKPENVSRRLGDGGVGLVQLNSLGQVRAAWSHPLSASQYIDPLSGQIFDQVGVFYAARIGEGNWTLPVQIGTLAPFSSSMDFILTDQDEPMIAWQSEQGVVVSIRQNGRWGSPYLLAPASIPDTPAPFGPDRWGEITAEIRLAKDPAGQIYAAWVTSIDGLFWSSFDGDNWSEPQQVAPASWIINLQLAATADGVLHLLYFQNDGLVYTEIIDGRVRTKPLSIFYTGYGLEESQLIADNSGFIYALGLPRNPAWTVFIPATGLQIPPTPTVTFTPSPTSTPSPVPSATPTSLVITPTPGESETVLETSGDQKFVPSSWIIALLVIVIGCLFAGVLTWRARK